jgi:hypothetical protein
MKLYRVRDSVVAETATTFEDLCKKSGWTEVELYVNAHDENQAALLFDEIYNIPDLPEYFDIEEVADLTVPIMANLIDPIVGIYH